MENKLLLNDLKQGKSKIYTLSFLVALFLMATSTFAQVQIDKVRLVPTIEGDVTTIFEPFGTYVTDTMPSNNGTSLRFDDGSDRIDLCRTGAWAEYQIISPLGGTFVVTAFGGSKASNALLNIGVYQTEYETWPAEGRGDTVAIDNNGNWNSEIPYYFPITLEGGIYYTMRINWLSVTGGDQWTFNVNDLTVTELTGSIDATLSDLKINGETIEGFSPNIASYAIPMAPGEWITSLEATVNHDSATADVPDEFPLDGTTGTYEIVVTSESKITRTYTIQAFAPTEIYDQLAWGEAGWTSIVYTNHNAGVRGWGINNFHNNDYVDFYVFSPFDDNLALTINYTNGFGPNTRPGAESAFNVSTLGLNDTAWTVNDIYTQDMPPTKNAGDTAVWDPADLWAQDVDFVFSLKANEPTLLRIYAITNTPNVANVQGLSFTLLYTSIDASLSDLKVDGSTVEGFNPMTTSYTIPVPAGTTSATVDATANDAAAQGVTGTGAVDISGFITSDTVTVTSEHGNTVDYKLNFYSPIELTFAESDSIELAMGDQLFDNNGVSANNTLLNWFQDGDYLDYYIYSATDLNVSLIVNASNGNQDTTSCKLNVSTFTVGSDWTIDEANSGDIPQGEVDNWADSVATDVAFDFSLTGGEAVMLRLYGVTTAPSTLANIYGLAFIEDDNVSIESLAIRELTVLSGTGSLTVLCNEAFIGGSVEIFDISGRLITRDLVESTRNDYSINRRGIFLVRVVGTNNEVRTAKCIVK